MSPLPAPSSTPMLLGLGDEFNERGDSTTKRLQILKQGCRLYSISVDVFEFLYKVYIVNVSFLVQFITKFEFHSLRQYRQFILVGCITRFQILLHKSYCCQLP